MNTITTDFGILRWVFRDGEVLWQLECPGCSLWADLDADQLNGRVSVLHEDCGYHQTHDFASSIRAEVEATLRAVLA